MSETVSRRGSPALPLLRLRHPTYRHPRILVKLFFLSSSKSCFIKWNSSFHSFERHVLASSFAVKQASSLSSRLSTSSLRTLLKHICRYADPCLCLWSTLLHYINGSQHDPIRFYLVSYTQFYMRGLISKR